MTDLHSTTTFHLSEDEVPVYDAMCREVGIKPEKYRSSRKVTCPVFHIVDLGLAFASYGAEKSTVPDHEQSFENVKSWVDAAGELAKKSVDSLDDEQRELFKEALSDDPRFKEPGI